MTDQGKTLYQPLISIITVVFNGERHLQQTIESVASQTYTNVEYIIIDGASEDESVKIIQDNSEHIKYWVSEPDQGIADAMNKGVAASTGDYVLFLHADDYLKNVDVIASVIPHLSPEVDLLACNIEFVTFAGACLYQPRGLGFWTNFKNAIHHQGAFCSRRMMQRVGLFDVRLTIAMDYDFFLRAYRLGFQSTQCSKVISVMRGQGVSSRLDKKTLTRRLREERFLHNKNCRSVLLKAVYRGWWALYPSYKLRSAA